MQVKIDTRGRFHAIHIQEQALAANMTADLDRLLEAILQNDVKNVALNFKDIQKLDGAAAQTIARWQQRFIQHKASFVLCAVQPSVLSVFQELELWDSLNTAPTESEASDIIHMEEIEREFLSADDQESNN